MKVGKKKNRSLRKLMYLIPVSALLGVPITANAKEYTYPLPTGEALTKFDSIAPPSDTYVVNDIDSPTLDRYLFRGDSGGFDITIPINVRRYVGNVDKLLETGLISPTFKIYIPAFDVDGDKKSFDCDNDGIIDNFDSEVNVVYFNEVAIGVLKGENNKWHFNDQFELDIKKLHFPRSEGDIGYNTINIKIDVANENVLTSSGQVGCKVWATKLDWAAVRFEVTSPVAFVPGFFNNANWFEASGYDDALMNSTGLPSEAIEHSFFVSSFSACSPEIIPSLTAHAEEMRNTLKAFAEKYGTDAVHLIAHSKGGLDSRVFLKKLVKKPLFVQVGEMGGQPVQVELSVESLVMHSSPHLGSVVADVILVRGVPFSSYFVADSCDLTTRVMQQVNKDLKSPPVGITTLLIGADADQNSDGQIDANEAAGNPVGEGVSTIFYGWLRDIASVYIKYEFDPFLDRVVPVVVEIPTAFPQPNDTVVTIKSAFATRFSFNSNFPALWANGTKKFVGSVGKNHATVLDWSVQNFVIEQGLTGVLNWSLR